MPKPPSATPIQLVHGLTKPSSTDVGGPRAHCHSHPRGGTAGSLHLVPKRYTAAPAGTILAALILGTCRVTERLQVREIDNDEKPADGADHPPVQRVTLRDAEDRCTPMLAVIPRGA